ncbi:MAG TPA: hypothetical protein VHF51_08645 [Solirubrobacteraceae bacterium]|jgi:hypothetical protein|nr:hypothetical protein [Solirubrobacteraceae bacterium]
MKRRIAVPALFAIAASAVAYALLRLRRGGGPSSERARPPGSSAPEPQEYRCECGQTFLVSGAGRHRVYRLPDASPSDPVLAPTCPSCERPLPRDPQTAGDPAR